MINIVTNFKNCVGITLVCLVVAFFQTLIDGSIESQTKKGEGVCTVGQLAQAGKRADTLYNDLRRETIVVELTCGDVAVVTKQTDVILAWSKSRPESLQCLWHANNMAKCELPKTAEAAQ